MPTVGKNPWSRDMSLWCHALLALLIKYTAPNAVVKHVCTTPRDASDRSRTRCQTRDGRGMRVGHRRAVLGKAVWFESRQMARHGVDAPLGPLPAPAPHANLRGAEAKRARSVPVQVARQSLDGAGQRRTVS